MHPPALEAYQARCTTAALHIVPACMDAEGVKEAVRNGEADLIGPYDCPFLRWFIHECLGVLARHQLLYIASDLNKRSISFVVGDGNSTLLRG